MYHVTSYSQDQIGTVIYRRYEKDKTFKSEKAAKAYFAFLYGKAKFVEQFTLESEVSGVRAEGTDDLAFCITPVNYGKERCYALWH